MLRGYLDTAKRDPAREHHGDGIHLAADDQPSPGGQAVLREETVRLAEGLSKLPRDMQQVLLGRHVDGCSHADLAERMGRTEGAIRVLYTRALRRLKDVCGE